MKRIQLWLVDSGPTGPQAVPIEELADTETERQLEDLLVASPELLVEDLTLVARQLPTEGGPLDLVGVDGDGRLTVFELKRGTLTRDAVAQVLDYASDLAQMEAGQLSRLIEENSGSRGIERLEDFADWYHREFPDIEEPFAQPPRMVLVGLGADSRATRIVNFLAKTGIDIQLLTFHAFRSNGQVLLGRQAETVKPAVVGGRGTNSKTANLGALLEFAEQVGVKELLTTVADFIESHLSGYRWPGKTAFSFSLQDRTSEGRPTWRSHLTLYVMKKHPRSVVLTIATRAAETATDGLIAFRRAVPEIRDSVMSGVSAELTITSASWDAVAHPLEEFLHTLATAAQARVES